MLWFLDGVLFLTINFPPWNTLRDWKITWVSCGIDNPLGFLPLLLTRVDFSFSSSCWKTETMTQRSCCCLLKLSCCLEKLAMPSRWEIPVHQCVHVFRKTFFGSECSMGPVRIGHRSHHFATQSSHLWMELGGKPKGLPLNFGYHDVMRTVPVMAK